ncbi:MAG: hypothetical protein ABEN55_05365 [Bradymonadaceae bacterium]
MRRLIRFTVATAAIWALAAVPDGIAADKPGGEPNDDPSVSLPALLQSFDDEPSVRAVRDAALEHADLEESAVGNWAARARWSNLLPELKGEIAWLDQRDEEFRYSEDIEANDNGRLERESAENRVYQDTRFRRVYSIEAELDLGGLVFDRDELSASRERRKRELARRKLVARVTDLYFERRKKQILRLAAPPDDWRKRLDLVLAIDRLTARLDGLTGGWFRNQLTGGKPGEDSDE